MKPVNSIFAIVAFLISTCGAALAKDELATTVLEKSGAVESVRTLPEGIRAQVPALREQGMAIEPEFEIAWNEAALRSFQTEKIVPAMAATVSELLSETDLRQLVEFYDTPFAKRIVQFEIDGAHPNKQAAAKAYAETLATNPKEYAKRMALYKELDEAAGLTNLAINLSIKMAIAIQSGMMSSGKMPMQLTYEELKQAIEQQRPMLQQQATADIYAIMTYTYRDMTEAEMQSYIKFMQTTLGKKFFAAYTQAVDQALSDASREFGENVAKGLGRKPI